METPAPESVQVNIFHRTYSLRSHGGGEHIRRIARLVDERMQMISSQLATHDIAKIAVLAALNIADEMEGLRDHYEQELQTLLAQAAKNGAPEKDEGASAPAIGRPGTSDERGSWFEDIFGSEEPIRSESERLSSQISAKLRMLRQTGQEPLITESDQD